MKKTLLVLMTLLVAMSVQAQQPAQLRLPRPSPKATMTQTIGITDMTVNYSRPSVKGRQIWGALVPYDQVWRTGANEATTIMFSDDVLVGGQKLAKGTYSLHTIPGKDEWTVIFNSVADQWGSYSYDAAKDVVRIKARPEKGEYRELLTIGVSEMTTDTAKVVIRWENVVVPFIVDTQSVSRSLAAADKAITAAATSRWQTPYRAADFAFSNNRMDEAQRWLDMALKENENTATLWLKARMLEKQGKRADAIRTAEAAIAKASADQQDFATEIRKQSDPWRK